MRENDQCDGARSLADPQRFSAIDEGSQKQRQDRERWDDEDRFDAGEALLEIGLVICSMTLLTKKKIFWFSGMAIAGVGVAIACTAFLLH